MSQVISFEKKGFYIIFFENLFLILKKTFKIKIKEKYMLSKEQVEQFKNLLLEERRSIITELIEDKNILNENMDNLGDLSELAFENLDKELVTKISVVQQETLKSIEYALKQIAQGQYGICEVCQNPIALERLEVLPYATSCRNCNK